MQSGKDTNCSAQIYTLVMTKRGGAFQPLHHRLGRCLCEQTLVMQLSGKAKGRLRTRETHHLLMKERCSVLVHKVPGERVVMKAVLKAAIWPSITQITSLHKHPLHRISPQSQTASTPPSHHFIVADVQTRGYILRSVTLLRNVAEVCK